MQVIRTLRTIYSNAPANTYGAILREALQDYCYPNGPLNILKAIYVLEAVRELQGLGVCEKTDFEVILQRCEVLTGYTRGELLERL